MHTILFPEYDNTQTNFLSRNHIGTWGGSGNLRQANRARSHPPIHQMTDVERERRFQEAVDILQSHHLKFVGILEYWNDSLRLFCRLYQCDEILLHESLKAKPERQQQQQQSSALVSKEHRYPYSNSAVEAVRQSNSMDTALYHVALQRFCQDLSQFQNDFEFMSTIQNDTVQICVEFNSPDKIVADTRL
jgi:hypothetical protein